MGSDVLFKVSYVLNWIILLVVSLAVFVLFRLLAAETRRREKSLEKLGPKLNESIHLSFKTVENTDYALGPESNRSHVILFGASDNRDCDDIAPLMHRFSELKDARVIVVYASDTEKTRRYVTAMPSGTVAVADPRGELFRLWRIPGTPYMVIADKTATIRKKGLVSDLESVEPFIEAARLA